MEIGEIFTKCITFTQLGIIWGICIPLIAILVAIIMRELRNRLGLEKYQNADFDDFKTAEIIALILIILLIIVMIISLFWFLICLIPSQPQSKNRPAPIKTPIQLESPSPRNKPTDSVGPIEIYPPVEIDGSEFKLYKFVEDYYWVYGKLTVKHLDELKSDQQMLDYLKNIHSDITHQDAIICVGTASYDTKRGTEYEEDRALNRAVKLTNWMRLVFGDLKGAEKSPELRKLNLGHYQQSPDSDDQRAILVIGVKRLSSDAPSIEQILSKENQETLKRKLEDKDFPFKFEDYSRFELIKAS